MNMKRRMLSLFIVLPTLFHGAAFGYPLEVNVHVAQKPWLKNEKPDEEPRIESAISIKERDHKDLPFNKLVPVEGAPSEFVYFTKDFRAHGCAFSCSVIEGIVAKWSNYYVQLQPYRKQCPVIKCSVVYPEPAKRITFRVGEKEYVVNSFDRGNYIYYLPLNLRQALASADTASVKVQGGSMDVLRVRQSSLADLKRVLNLSDEPHIASADDDEPGQPKGKEERLREADDLRKKGLISEEEYTLLRERIIMN